MNLQLQSRLNRCCLVVVALVRFDCSAADSVCLLRLLRAVFDIFSSSFVDTVSVVFGFSSAELRPKTSPLFLRALVETVVEAEAKECPA